VFRYIEMPAAVQKTDDATTGGEEEEEAEFVVEKILTHRFNKKGKKEYYLKWKGFPEEENTWEPAENLNCTDLVEAYEANNKNQDDEKPAKKTKNTKPPSSEKVQDEEKPAKKTKTITPVKEKVSGVKRKSVVEEAKVKKKGDKRNGFEKGLTAESITGAVENNGETLFLIKWKEAGDFELVPSKVANVNIPQMVIAFYEARLSWAKPAAATPEKSA